MQTERTSTSPSRFLLPLLRAGALGFGTATLLCIATLTITASAPGEGDNSPATLKTLSSASGAALPLLQYPFVSSDMNASAPRSTLTNTLYLPALIRPEARLVISAAHIDSVISGEGDEAVEIWNTGAGPQSLAGWQIRGNGRTATVPITSSLSLAPGESLWCAGDGAVFARTFGFWPACEWNGATPHIPDLAGSAPRLTNQGGVLELLRPDGASVDIFVYGNESAIPPGWQGPAAQVYARGSIPREGQVQRRKLEVTTNLPLDTDTASDWSGDLADLEWGRQVFFPGWQIWRPRPQGTHTWPVPHTVTAQFTVAIGPDGLYRPIAEYLAEAAHSIDLSLYTLEHPELVQLLAEAARRGVTVRLLLEGSPAGGISQLQRWCLAQLALAGVQVAFMDSQAGAPAGHRPRYRYLHAKYGIVDGKVVLVGTENFSRDAIPVVTGGTVPPGHRGLYIFTDAVPVVAALQEIFGADWQPEQFWDLRFFDPVLDGPSPTFVPPAPPAPSQPAIFAQPLVHHTAAQVAVEAGPETVGRGDALLYRILARTGAGDTVDWMQLYEHKHWGESTSNPVADPSPRLVALIEAARRGAVVRILLDSYFDTPGDQRSNQATADYLHALAKEEGLDLQVRLANPTQKGIHTKMALIQSSDEYWTVTGSLNGGEVSHKLNREVSLFVENAAVYAYLRHLFEHDWSIHDWSVLVH